jgi:hypothetical protein
MVKHRLRVLMILLGLLFGAALWVLNIELTYERNIRRGIPADFRIHRPRALDTWRT